MTIPTIQCEVQLLSWSVSHNGGAKIVLALSDEDDLLPWKALTIRKGNHAGQRLMLVACEIGDDERPVQTENANPAAEVVAPAGTPDTPSSATGGDVKPARKNGRGYPPGLAGLAVRWSTPPIAEDFVEFAWSELGEAAYKANEKLDLEAEAPDLAAAVIRAVCNITSRKELETDEAAKGLFDRLIRGPYSASRKARGLEA